MEAVRVILRCKNEEEGFGEAPASALITGETLPSIEEAITAYIGPAIVGRCVDGDLGSIIQSSIQGNSSAKAAVEMAWQDLRAQKSNIPLYRLLTENDSDVKRTLANDITISAGKLECMTFAAISAIEAGFSMLKIKTGSDPVTDSQNLISLYNNIKNGFDPKNKIRVDANQGWSPRQAIGIIRALEDAGIPIDLVEQPVPAWDLDGLLEVSSSTSLPIAADESVFSPQDALLCIQKRAAQIINIKLMKSGGIGPALDICGLCRVYGLECMIGCMMEGQLSTAAAAHLAASQPIITRVDLDSPLLCADGFYSGGPAFCGPDIKLSDCPGIGTRPIL